jgi:hypothetical protein
VSTLSRLTKALSKLRKARALRTPGGGTPFIYLTEYGYFARHRGQSRRARKYAISPARQASYLKKGFQLAQRNPRVKQMLQYLLVQPPSRTSFFATHIMSRSFRPYRAYNTLKSWAASEARRGGVRRNPLN